jgi:hypothetical protein
VPINIYIPPPWQTRRGFLRKGVFGGLLLALGGGGFLALRRSRIGPMPPDGLMALDERECAVLQAISARFVVPMESFPSADEVGTASNVDRMLASAEESVRVDFKRLLSLFENGLTNFLFGRRPRPFTQLSPGEQDEVLREWRDSRLALRRSGYQALHMVVLFAYYSSSASWPAVGYPGPPQGLHQSGAPEWKGGGEARPKGNGLFLEDKRQDAEVEP